MKETLVKVIALLGLVAILGLAACDPGVSTTSTTTSTSTSSVASSVSSVPADAIEVTVWIKPAAGMPYNLYGVWGSFTTNSTTANRYVYDGSWSGPAVVFTNATATTNAQGYFVAKLLFSKTNTLSTNDVKFQIRAYTNLTASHVDGYTFYSDENVTKMVSNSSSNWLFIVDVPGNFSANSYLSIKLNLTAMLTNGMDMNNNGTKGEIGDMWVGGAPSVVFGGYNDALSASSKTNTNTAAYTASGDTVFQNILIPSGTTTSLDVSIGGTNDLTGLGDTTWNTGRKLKVNCTLKNQVSNTITVTAVWANGGFGKVDSTVSGDINKAAVSNY